MLRVLAVAACLAAPAHGSRSLARPRTHARAAAVMMATTRAPPGSLKALCEISKEACDAVEPMLKAFYAKITEGSVGDATKKKSDATFFTIADGILQNMFVEHLLAGDKFAQIVGEEDGSTINLTSPPYSVDELTVPAEFEDIVEQTLRKIQEIGAKIDPLAYKDITVFVDPIDGTREFATGQGDKVTILLGFNDRKGLPCAGIMYRPLTSPITWASGAKSEGYKAGQLDMAKEPNLKGCLITDGKVSPFIAKTIDSFGGNLVPSVASGNRTMMLLEGKAGWYIRDTGGFALWDTSGPQACIEAYGGTMSKLPQFIGAGQLESYKHLKTYVNLDFEPGKVMLSLTNVRDKSEFVKGTDVVASFEQIIPYVCCAGLVTASAPNMGKLEALQKAMRKVAADGSPPYYT